MLQSVAKYCRVLQSVELIFSKTITLVLFIFTFSKRVQSFSAPSSKESDDISLLDDRDLPLADSSSVCVFSLNIVFLSTDVRASSDGPSEALNKDIYISICFYIFLYFYSLYIYDLYLKFFNYLNFNLFIFCFSGLLLKIL